MEKLTGTYTFISEGIMIVAQMEDGKVISSSGTVVKAEQIELDHVKVTRGDIVEYIELSDKVRWMSEDGGPFKCD